MARPDEISAVDLPAPACQESTTAYSTLIMHSSPVQSLSSLHHVLNRFVHSKFIH
jgi:hypothetical protein